MYTKLSNLIEDDQKNNRQKNMS